MKVLIADDSRELTKFLSLAMGRDGIDTKIAHDGNEAIALGIDGAFDAIILDVSMPYMSGFEACRALRSGGVDVPILFLSSSDDEVSRLKGFRAGGDDYVIKPFSYLELKARVKRSVERSNICANKKTISYEGLQIDMSNRVCTYRNRSIKLTEKELGLLHRLALNEGHAVSKISLLQMIWGSSPSRSTTRLPVCVSTLNRKLTSASADSMRISNLRGYGYQLVATI